MFEHIAFHFMSIFALVMASKSNDCRNLLVGACMHEKDGGELKRLR